VGSAAGSLAASGTSGGSGDFIADETKIGFGFDFTIGAGRITTYTIAPAIAAPARNAPNTLDCIRIPLTPT
jgi:hypothetical protein